MFNNETYIETRVVTPSLVDCFLGLLLSCSSALAGELAMEPASRKVNKRVHANSGSRVFFVIFFIAKATLMVMSSGPLKRSSAMLWTVATFAACQSDAEIPSQVAE